MTKKEAELVRSRTLRQRAEAEAASAEPDIKSMSYADIAELVHELQVLQIELQMQNDELRRTEQELTESQARYSDLYDFAPVGYFTCNSRGIMMEVNLSASSMLGVERMKLRRKHFQQFVVGEDGDTIHKHLQDIFREEIPQSCEIRIKNVRDETQSHVQLTSILRETPEGLRCRTAMTDITERKEAEEALRESTLRLELALGAGRVGLWDWDMGTNQAYFSPEWKSQIGYEPDEMPNMYEEWKKRLHPDDRDRVIDTLRDYIEGKNSGYIVEFRLQHKDGSYRWMSAQGELVAGTSRMMGCHIDITERKLAEEALQREKEFAENLVDTAQAIVLVLDPEGRIVRFNPYMEDISGYTLKEMQGRDWFTTFLPGNDQDRIHSIFAQAISDTQTSGNVNSILTKDGSERFIEWYDKTLKDADGHIVGILAIGQDVTERMRTEEELKQTLEDLKRSNQALEQFAYIVSHDLQEPLRMVASYVQLLEKRYKDHLDQDANDFIKFAVDGAIRMQQMILDILEYSRVGTKDQSFKKVDLNSVLSQVIASLGGQIEVSGALVTSDKLPTVLADEMQIAQLFQNLLGNAIKFRGESTPQIHISCEADNGDWVTSVKDNGIGIPQEFQDRIFAVFRKLHAIGQYPGSGIGLAISAKIVERHGGRIWVESEPEKGSTFFFTIPK